MTPKSIRADDRPRGRILVVDDEVNIRSALARALNLLGYPADEASSGSEAMRLLQATAYDLMVLDMRMPGMDGTQVMTQAHKLRPDMPTVILTGHATLESAIAAVKSGAADYVLKPASISEIVSAISRALEQRSARLERQRLLQTALDALRQAETLETPEESRAPSNSSIRPGEPEGTVKRFLRAGLFALDREKRQVIVEDTPVRIVALSEGEFEILSLLATRADRVLSCAEIVRAAWGYDIEDWEAQSLVRPYVFRIRQKLETTPESPRFIRTVRGRGYLLATT